MFRLVDSLTTRCIILDIDECLSNPCSNWTSDGCQNTVGSYKCLCKTGFEHVSSTCQGE